MHKQVMPYKPKNLSEDKILCAELQEKGSKAADKRLLKGKKGTYPTTETAADCSTWWMLFKDGKKKDKIAMVIMASHYTRVVKQVDRSESKVLQLEAKTKSQEEEISSMKLKLLQWEEENKRLNFEISTNSSEVVRLKAKTKSQNEEIKLLKLELLQWEKENKKLNFEIFTKSGEVVRLEAKTESQEEEIKLLKQTVQEQEVEINQLKEQTDNYNASCDEFKNSLSLPAPVIYNGHLKRPFYSLLTELPDLQYDNSNYEFWAKIKSWLLKGEVDPQCIFRLVESKCPLNAWQAIEKKFNTKDLKEMASSNPAKVGTLIGKLWKRVSEALGPGTNSFEQYYYRRQEVGEPFEGYLEKKFKLYCSYGVDNMEPDKNDHHFLNNVIEKAAKSYETLKCMYPKSYTELLNKAKLIDSMLMTADYNNECLNCGRRGHTKAQCRRPGGDAEVGPNQCFTCGGYGHWARNCGTYE